MRKVRRVDVWGFRVLGLILISISGFGFNSDLVSGDCGIGLLILLIAGVWMLVGDPKKIAKVLR